ncbi:hypothetical protein AB0442_37235 [Kitasatospora sp. NPDC085895]|uniref:hypothetical protein n=1 Tax=Kitasatospora sp. NPDC085895 TaxID=3155057 RepID=UPI00344B95F1
MTGRALWDTVAAPVIGSFIAVRAIALGRQVPAVPGRHGLEGLDAAAVAQDLAGVAGVADVHDLHR